jgi:hypothetical protein
MRISIPFLSVLFSSELPITIITKKIKNSFWPYFLFISNALTLKLFTLVTIL